MTIDIEGLQETLAAATGRLLAERDACGIWRGELSSSALSTATAVFALAQADQAGHCELIECGLDWLARNANQDGGWGDSDLSPSNPSTTLLVWSALSLAEDDERFAAVIRRAERWLADCFGSVAPDKLATALLDRYGDDRTFSVPILTMCALAGRLGPGRAAWRRVRQLPFELAALPAGLWRRLRLQVVSYALPALIAVGLVRHRRRPTRNPIARLLRRLATGRTLRLLQRIQPTSGGFLEAAPLTSFVAMSLIGAGLRTHPTVAKAVEFLRATVRADGSWPIDTDLATWLTTLSAQSLGRTALDDAGRERICEWILAAQHRTVHPYTRAAAGGWAWTDRPGGVPDADDTAGAMLALHRLAPNSPSAISAARAGACWLLGLQNRDGGMGTFCRGWSALPFDRSAPDLTAHAIQALQTWREAFDTPLRRRVERAIGRAVGYLADAQRSDGAWTPLWFGNTAAPGEQNPTYGTTRVLSALSAAGTTDERARDMIARATHWLVAAQNTDGGWGGAADVPASIEETALATIALADVLRHHQANGRTDDAIHAAILRGAAWLVDRTDRGRNFPPAPIGLYFARLWYFEKLYPIIFTVTALNRAHDL